MWRLSQCSIEEDECSSSHIGIGLAADGSSIAEREPRDEEAGLVKRAKTVYAGVGVLIESCRC